MKLNLQKKLCEELRKIPLCMVRKNNGSSTEIIGYPDLTIFFWPECVLFVEVKEPGDTIREDQKVRFKQLEELGFSVYILQSVEQIKQITHIVTKTIEANKFLRSR